MKIDISQLMTIKNYALKERVTPAYIYKLIKEGKMQPVIINDVQFINVKDYSTIPVLNRRK